MTAMRGRPDLIGSELSGLAFDSNLQIFKSCVLEIMFAQAPPRPVLNEAIYIFIDPAAGGPARPSCRPPWMHRRCSPPSISATPTAIC